MNGDWPIFIASAVIGLVLMTGVAYALDGVGAAIFAFCGGLISVLLARWLLAKAGFLARR